MTGILLLILPAGNLSSFLTTTQQAVFSNPQHFQLGGLLNRIVLVVAFAWYLVTAVRLLRSRQLSDLACPIPEILRDLETAKYWAGKDGRALLS